MLKVLHERRLLGTMVYATLDLGTLVCVQLKRPNRDQFSYFD